MLIVGEDELSRPHMRHCHGNRQSEKGRARSSMWNMSIVKLNKFVCFSHRALLPETRVCACVRGCVCLFCCPQCEVGGCHGVYRSAVRQVKFKKIRV